MNIFIIKLVQRISSFFPGLKKQLRIAHIKTTPRNFIYKSIKFAFPFSLGLTILFFFIFDKAEIPFYFLPLAFIILFILTFNFAFLKVKARITKRQKEIDREVLFAGQYLLIKLNSGKPLLNALIDTSQSYGVSSKYVKEIIKDIDTGSSLEDALESAMTYSPSEKFRKILFQINNAMKLGIDVTGPLRSVLEDINQEQKIEVERYGKKLNTVVIFYMLGAVVIPSIGMTIFIVASGFINFNISTIHFFVAVLMIMIIQFLFMAVFKTIRPVVNI